MSDKIEQVTRISTGLGTLMWVSGWVLSTGFWSTFWTVVFPPWAWYVTLRSLFAFWGIA